jgi:predicted MFS family arabinose efflux permease
VNQVAALIGVTTARNRKHAYGLKEGILGIGIFAGSLIGGLLPGLFAGLIGQTTADPAPYRFAMIAASLVSLSGIAPLLLLSPIDATAQPRLSLSALPPLRPLLVIALCAYLNNAALASARAFSPAYMDTVFGLPTALIGAIMSMGTFAAILAAFSSARVARRRGSIFAMLIASLVMCAGLIFMAVLPGWGFVAVGLVCTIGFSSMWMPAYQVVQMELVAPEWRAVVAGIGSTAGSLGFGSMSLAGGFIVVGLGYQWLYAIAAAMVLGSAGLALILQSRRARAANAQS